jgi:ParB family chromosome partitioning protein
MAKSNKPSVLGMFAGAAGSQQVFELEGHIEELQAEIARLKANQTTGELAEAERNQLNQIVEALREQLKETGGVVKVHHKDIKPNPKQPRQTFAPDSIHSMAVSIREEGQQQPIILLPGNLLFDGERRWRAVSEYLHPEIETLNAVILPRKLSEAELHSCALLTSLHREGLNDLDLAEGLTQQVKFELDVETEETIKAVRRAIARLNTKKLLPQLTELVTTKRDEQSSRINTFELDDIERGIFLLLLRFQQNPASVDANVFPTLRFPIDLKQAIRQSGLGTNHARLIQQLNTKKLEVSEEKALRLRQDVVLQVLGEKLTINETRALVGKIITEQQPEQKQPSQNRKIEALIRNVSDASLEDVNLEQLQKLLVALETKAKEIRRNLQ